MATVATGQIPPAGFTPTRTTTSIVATVRRVFPSTASRPVCQTAPSCRQRSSRRAVCIRPSCPSLSASYLDLRRGTRGAGAPPFQRPLPLCPRAPRSGPGYVVPVHHHLSGPMRPTRRQNSISPHSGLYALPSLCAELRRLGDPRVDPCFRWHSFSTCRPPGPREVHRL
jgi:hypothetical protein